ncbi:response regulator transcription factor [Lactovum odontotermitis]
MYKTIVLEDEKLIRDWIVLQLEKDSELQVIASADNGERGVELIHRLQPDLLVSDIHMPKLTAFELLKQFPQKSFATVIISGYNDFENAQKAINQDVCAFVEKPIDPLALGEAMNKAKERVAKIQLLEKSRLYEKTENIKFELGEFNSDIHSELMKYIKANYQKKIYFPDLAHDLGYGESTLYRIIKEAGEISFTELLNRYRIQKSIEIQFSEKHTLEELAERVGFSDAKYFVRVFKKVTGSTPKDFFSRN